MEIVGKTLASDLQLKARNAMSWSEAEKLKPWGSIVKFRYEFKLDFA
jgi:hypothetical protein